MAKPVLLVGLDKNKSRRACQNFGIWIKLNMKHCCATPSQQQAFCNISKSGDYRLVLQYKYGLIKTRMQTKNPPK